MNLPAGFLDDLRTRTSLSQVVGRKVTWDARKSNPGKGDLWAPCPFHQEKSPSFHVDDRKGFYYCFGCHAKGDAVTFVKDTENVSFMEAVEILARAAGMPMPERDPVAAERADQRTELSKVIEEAFKWFRLQLKTSAAAEARGYIAKRGLSQAALDRWEIGYAPDQRQGLFLTLTQIPPLSLTPIPPLSLTLTLIPIPPLSLTPTLSLNLTLAKVANRHDKTTDRTVKKHE